MSLRRIVAVFVSLAILTLVSGCGGEPVPDLIGERFIMSSLALQREGFVLGEVRHDEHAPDPVGTVIGQNPRPGRGAQPGSPVNVTVAGPALVRMPRLVGTDRDEARKRLRALGLRRGRVTERFDVRVPASVVIEQSRTTGTSLEQGARVDMVVSLGPETRLVPGVVGRHTDDARSLLRDLSFVASQRFEHSPRPVGQIIAQSPEARMRVPLGERVRLTVSMGPVMRMMPNVEGIGLSQAKKQLDESGLKYAVASTGGAVIIPAGSVVAKQDPLPGKLIPQGVTVILRTEVP